MARVPLGDGAVSYRFRAEECKYAYLFYVWHYLIVYHRLHHSVTKTRNIVV